MRPLLLIWLVLLVLKGCFALPFSWWWVSGFCVADLLTFTCGYIGYISKK